MSFNLDTIQIRTDLTDLLKANLVTINTGLNNGLSSENKIVNFIYTGFPFNAPDLPQLCVYQVSKSNEDFSGLGAGGRKDVDVTFEITGIVRIVKATKIDTRYLDDVITMANNIDYVLRENIQFSTLILSSNPQSYEIVINDTETSTYVCMFKTLVICKADVLQCNC